jgi:ATP-dependent DNA helicase MPH1
LYCIPSQDEREFLWKSKRLFFSTPQTVENDLNRGVVDAKRIICLVIDEAHRATGNYSYVVLVQRLWSLNQKFRILAMSATPGSDFRKIQNLIQTLKVARIEIRTEDDPDVARYCFEKQIEIMKCKAGLEEGLESLKNMTNDLMKASVLKLYQAKLLSTNQPKLLNSMVVDEAQRY